MTTQTDIARLAGVSVSTVSRALNNDQRRPVNSKTKNRILKIARKLNYYRVASHENEGNYGKLVCLLASESDSFADLFFSNMLLGIQNQSQITGYQISNAFSTSSTEITEIFTQINLINPEGIIIMGRVSNSIMNDLKKISNNIVYAGLNRVNCGIDEVICDAYRAIEKTVEYLNKLNFKKIGFIGTFPNKNQEIINEHRFIAFKDSLNKFGIKFEKKFCRNISLDVDEAYDATLDLINSGNLPDAICCANDIVAIAVIKALHDNDYNVPKDVSITGMDDIETAKFFQPSLTTSHMHDKAIGELAVRILHDRLMGRHEIPLVVELPSKLITRDSCMPKT